jgi:hypothetical protein
VFWCLGRWFGATPETVLSVDGDVAERRIPKIRSVIENYRFRADGGYHPSPGPNSNTFVQAALDAVIPTTARGMASRHREPAYSLRGVAISD